MSVSLQKRESCRTVIGNGASRSLKVMKCCCARTVVGTSMATWRPSLAALNAARSASSVLPKPTSPQTTRSIGRDASMSRLISSSTISWSGVSWYGNDASSSRCQAPSGRKA